MMVKVHVTIMLYKVTYMTLNVRKTQQPRTKANNIPQVQCPLKIRFPFPFLVNGTGLFPAKEFLTLPYITFHLLVLLPHTPPQSKGERKERVRDEEHI